MNFKDFQEKTCQTALYPAESKELAMSYLTLGLCGEAGEVAEIIKKLLRKGIPMSELQRPKAETRHLKDQIRDELGDVLWYIGQICEQCDLDMGDVASRNIEKLEQRSKEKNIQKLD